MHYLSKSKLISGWQCGKRLWLEKYQPDEAEVSDRTEAVFAIGNQVGEVAQQQFPGGILIEHDFELSQALQETEEHASQNAERQSRSTEEDRECRDCEEDHRGPQAGAREKRAKFRKVAEDTLEGREMHDQDTNGDEQPDTAGENWNLKVTVEPPGFNLTTILTQSRTDPNDQKMNF